MGRPKTNYEHTPGRFPKGTLARIDATLAPGEKRSDFLRAAVYRELVHRERGTEENAQEAGAVHAVD